MGEGSGEVLCLESKLRDSQGKTKSQKKTRPFVRENFDLGRPLFKIPPGKRSIRTSHHSVVAPDTSNMRTAKDSTSDFQVTYANKNPVKKPGKAGMFIAKEKWCVSRASDHEISIFQEITCDV